MPKKSNQELSLFLDILVKLEDLKIPYVIIGGFAATIYGITRATYDIDIIVNMETTHINQLADAFPLPRYYADLYQMQNAMKIGSTFDIIDTERGEKADLFPLTMDVRYMLAFENRLRQTIEMSGMEPIIVWAARPEDVIVGKLLAWEEGRSERHTADIYEMILYYYLGGYAEDIIFDETYVSKRAGAIADDALALWELIRDSAKEEAQRLKK